MQTTIRANTHQCAVYLIWSQNTPDSFFHTAKGYTADHEAVVFDDSTGVGIVSITDHAQSALGDVVFVELPALGTVVEQGGKFTPIHLCF